MERMSAPLNRVTKMSKQVIVMRKFPKDRNMRTGKYCSQAAHASLGALFSVGSASSDGQSFVIPLHDTFIREWILGSFKKVVVYVDDDESLKDLHIKASNLGLPASLITDSGLTEFNGTPTVTALGIGPSDDSIIDSVTGHLPLF